MNHVLQEWIHQVEVGSVSRWVRALTGVMLLLMVAAAYDYKQFRNMSRPEAMDAAQVARSLARGEGFGTRFIRPLSIHLLERHVRSRALGASDVARLEGQHPDLANPPVYPLVLSGLLWLAPGESSAGPGAAFLIAGGDLRIAFLNQALLGVLMVLVYGLGRRLFDGLVGFLAAVAVGGSEMLWRFSVSGLPNLLLAVWVTALFGCLAALDQGSREEERPARWFVIRAIAVGLLVAAAGLTVYSALWLIVPVLIFLNTGSPGRRLLVSLVVVGVFAAAVTPWAVRNYSLCGLPLGTATYAAVADTEHFPGATLERSLEPQVDSSMLRASTRKVTDGAPALLAQIPGLGGSWVPALFLAGFLVRFVDPSRSRVRLLLLGTMGLFGLVQLLARTDLSRDAAGLTSENLIVTLAPLAMVFGAAMFCLLLDQASWRFEGARGVMTGGFVIVAFAPLALVLLQPRQDPRALPIYHPPLLRQFGVWMGPQEVTMSDVPWAVAWYGDRKSVWLPRKLQEKADREDFYAVHQFRHSVAALYLSPLTVDRPFFTEVLALALEARAQAQAAGTEGEGSTAESASAEATWGELVYLSLGQRRIPGGFPLRSAHAGFAASGHLVLADEARWLRPSAGRVSGAAGGPGRSEGSR